MSNRLSVLLAINAAGNNASSADIDDRTGLGVANVRFTIGDLKKSGLIETTKDAITGQPAYSLSKDGKEWLAARDGVPDVPTVKESLVVGTVDISNARDELDQANRANAAWIALAREFGCTCIPTLRKMINEIAGEATAKRIEASSLKTMLEAVAESSSADMKRIADLEAAVDMAQQTIASLELEAEQDRQELQRLKAENLALTTLNESMPGFGATFAGMTQADMPAGVTLKSVGATSYMVRSPKKPPRVFSKRINAEAAAMSGARAHGLAEVFALVPVGKAVRGAEWKDAA